MTVALVFLVLALLCFVLAAARVSSAADLTALGLACLTLSMILNTQGL